MLQSDMYQRIIAICDQELGSFSSDCSGFLKSVSSKLGILIVGNANSICDSIISDRNNAWKTLTSGMQAAHAAEQGKFVVGGLKANGNGHVVVVVKGPLANGKYPYAYWGQYHAIKLPDGSSVNAGFTRGHGTTNYAWGPSTRDKVIYAAIEPSVLLTNENTKPDYKEKGRIQF